jgi:hypothetical protein
MFMRTKLIALIAHPATAAMMAVLVPGGFLIWAGGWLYKRWLSTHVITNR